MAKIIQFPDRNVEADGKTGITIYYNGNYITGYITDMQSYESELTLKLEKPIMVDLPLQKSFVNLPPVWINLFHLPAYSLGVPDIISKRFSQNSDSL